MGIRAIPRDPDYDTTTHKHMKKILCPKEHVLSWQNQIKIAIHTAEWRHVVKRNWMTCLMPHEMSVIAGKNPRSPSLHTWGIKVDSFTCSQMMGNSPNLKTLGLSVTAYNYKVHPSYWNNLFPLEAAIAYKWANIKIQGILNRESMHKEAKVWLKENMPTKYSYCSYFQWNIQGKYRDSLCGEFIREISHSSKWARFRDPRDPFQANFTVKTHFIVCVNEHKHFCKSHEQFTQLFSTERLLIILHHFVNLLP